MEVTNPDDALVLGVMRTVRAKEPTASLVTLDVAGLSEQATVSSIDRVLKSVNLSVPPQLSDTEYVERRGVLHISRIVPDYLIDQAKNSNAYNAEAVVALDTLHYQKVSKEEIPLPGGCAEVDIHAASLNFKDVAIAMGLLQANEHLPGLEGGGIIRRLGQNTDSLKVGQRVVVSRKSSFANNLQSPVEAIYLLPDDMPYETSALIFDLPNASWRCIADNGTFVEIGKKDMADRNNLSMEPFCRNASYRPIDMSLDSVPLSTIARLLSQTFSLIEQGHVKPIQPRTKFSFKDIGDAFRYMRSGNHIEKIVITDGEDRNVKIPAGFIMHRQETHTNLDASDFIVGGLKASSELKNLVVMPRSGCDDDISQSVLFQLKALETDVVVIKGDVVKLDDVRVAFQRAIKPIAGIIQGVMLLRYKMFTFMSDTEFSEAIRPKQQGTWNLHNTAFQEGLVLDFFTMLSSICGVVGQTEQANYSASSSFLDTFSVYRQELGLKARSIDLGVIEDVGYVSSNENVSKKLNTQHWTPINESLLHKILRFSILQQTSAPISANSTTQMITGVPVPLHPDSSL
ncbi:hypothetical protein ABEW05_009893 [Botrytis cinerea]